MLTGYTLAHPGLWLLIEARTFVIVTTSNPNLGRCRSVKLTNHIYLHSFAGLHREVLNSAHGKLYFP
jgi:hypothetical protein